MTRKPPAYLLILLLLAAGTTPAATPVLDTAMDAHVQTASLPAQQVPDTHDALTLRIRTPDGPLELLLQPAAPLQAQAGPFVADIRSGATRLYQGRVADHSDSWVRMTHIDGAWLGAIKTPDRLWLLDPARQHPQLAGRLGLGAHDSLIFTLDDLQDLPPFDHGGLQVPMAAAFAPVAATPDDTDSRAGVDHYLGLTLALDTEFQSHYGANAGSVAVGMLNIVDGFYRQQTGTQVYLHALVPLASNGSLTSTDSSQLLNAFSSYSAQSLPFSGLAHLLSGKDFDGNVVGLAWTGVADPGYVTTVCNARYGTGVDQVTFSAAASAAILAHEMGHNQGAQHDSDGNSCPASGYIMNAITNLSSPPTEFSTCSLDYFDTYRTFRDPPCLRTPPDRIFANGFDRP